MAGLVSSILDYIRVNDDDDYDEYDEFDDVKEEPVVDNAVAAEEESPKRKARTQTKEEEVPAKRERFSRSERTKVVPMRNTSRDLEVCIVKPTSFEDSQQVCEVLLDGRACVVNLEGFDADDAQRIMDFISGCIFAIDGKLHRISKYIFIFAPSNIDISGDYLDLLPDDKKNTLTINKQF